MKMKMKIKKPYNKIRLFVLYIVFSILSVPLYSKELSSTFKGEIVNQETKKPIPDVSIRIINSNKGTVSNKNGEFVLKLDENDKQVLLSHVGFESQTIALDHFKEDSVSVFSLKPTIIQLNESVVVTSSRDEIKSFDNPDAVSLVTSLDLKNNAPRSIADALTGVTGVWMQQTNHGAGSPFLRGLTGNQTLLLVDGIRLNNATFRYGPNQYFNTLDVSSVKQLEVIRGKGSVLYGSDALGGVINVITRSPEYFSERPRVLARAKAKIMSHDMEYSGAGELEYQSKNVGLLANVNYKKFGDILAGKGLGFERPSGYDEFGVLLKGKFRIGDDWQVESSYHHLTQNDIDRFDQVSRNYDIYKFDPQIHDLAYVKAEHYSRNPLLKNMTITALYQNSGEKRKIQKQNSNILTKEEDLVNTYGFIYELHSQFSEKWQAVTGAEFYSDFINSSKEEVNIVNETSESKRGLYPDNSTSKNFALFTQHSLILNKIKLNAGARFNKFWLNVNDIEFGDVHLSPNSLVGNLSFQYFFEPQQQLILSAYSAFRAPNINDISSFGLFDYGIEVPSTDLKPEKSYSVEAGYKVSKDNFSMATAVFGTLIKDQIIRVEADYNGEEYFNGERVYKKQNADRSGMVGIEFESSLRLTSNLLFNNNATWLYGKNMETDEPMRRVPPLNGKLALQYLKSNFFSEVELLMAAKQSRLAKGDKDDHRIPEGGTPGWRVVNLKAGYSWNKICINVGINNLFNKAYRYHGSGIDGYGRSFWLSFNFK